MNKLVNLKLDKMKANIGKRSNFNIAQDEENLNRPIGTKEIE